MTHLEQLENWVNGKSIHNDEFGECCPDFSCCNPSNMATQEEKDLFLKAYKEHDETTKMTLLGGFLGSAIANYNPKINAYISTPLGPQEDN